MQKCRVEMLLGFEGYFRCLVLPPNTFSHDVRSRGNKFAKGILLGASLSGFLLIVKLFSVHRQLRYIVGCMGQYSVLYSGRRAMILSMHLRQRTDAGANSGPVKQNTSIQNDERGDVYGINAHD